MTHRFAEWRISVLSTLGLGAALGCGGSAFDGSAEAGKGAGANAGGTSHGGATNTAGTTNRAGATNQGGSTYGGRGASAGDGGRTLLGGASGMTSAGSTVGGSLHGGRAGSSGAAGEGGAGKHWECTNPIPFWSALTTVQNDEGAGGASGFAAPPADPIETTSYVLCGEGWLHRPRAYACPSFLPRNEVPTSQPGGACTTDADCTEKPLGYCEHGGQVTACQYGCKVDADCAAGNICVCGDPVGLCSPATCTTDVDCPSGSCAGTPWDLCGVTRYRFACATSEDACLSDSDCKPTEYCDAGSSPRRCTFSPICGRPFLVDGDARVAPLRTDAEPGRQTSAAPELAALDFADRRALAEHWSKLGTMEHASIAAFARFVLELLSLGAPADLVRDAQRALGDEIAHTELCFGLASAYAGRGVSAGALPIDGALEARSRTEIVKTAFLEACIGETLAAVEARLSCERARDAEVRRVLARIAEDEARHAELGWRFVQWALATSDDALAGELREMLRGIVSAERSLERGAFEATGGNERLADHGLSTDAVRWEARELALDELVLPWTSALCGRVAA